MDMEKRVLGKSGIEVSPMGLGCWAIGGPFLMFGKPDGWGEVDDAESIRAIHAAMEFGVTFFDTADAYGTGHSEEVLGKALAGRRDKVVVATKGGFVYDSAKKELIAEDTSPAYFRKALEASLLRLNTEYIDLYQIHNWAMPEANREALFEEFDRFVAEGKIRAYGWSTGEIGNARYLGERTSGSTIQHPANLFSYDPEMDAVCERYGLAMIINAPLAMGLLSGKFSKDSKLPADDVRGASHDWVRYFRDGRPVPELIHKLEAVREILTSGGRSPVQGALAWLWAKNPRNIPIPGFKNLSQAVENAGALAYGPLSEDLMRRIDILLHGESGS
jgi:aryl-alcohol dehydrogenase-like predicted oxidoreductase